MALEQKRNPGKGLTQSRTNKSSALTSKFGSLTMRAKQARMRGQNSGSADKKKALRLGDICNLKITALASNNIGIDEYSFPYPVFVPLSKEKQSVEVGIGSQIKAKVVKISESTYAVADFVELISSALKTNAKLAEALSKVPVKAGDVLTVSLKQVKENVAVAELANDYRLIVPLASKAGVNLENVKVVVTRVKMNYAFAKFENYKASTQNATNNAVQSQMEVGSKFTTTLDKSALVAFTKGKGKFLLLNVNGSMVFLKLKKGLSYNPNNFEQTNKVRVRIKITSKSENCLVGKILQFNPILSEQKSALILKNIREMINHGMHFGEKAVKCNARMKNYIWWLSPSASASNSNSLSNSSTKDRPLIKKGRHVINLLKTRRCLNAALNKLTKYALKGRSFLFIGTKKAASGLVARASFFTQNSFYVNTRWLGGMLTNWKTICKSISKIRPILKEKQKVVREILERRQAIKTRLVKKALLLRKKSKLILNKGRLLLETLRKDKGRLLSQAQQLTTLRNDFIRKGMLYVEKRQKLIQKRKELILQAQTLLLKERSLELSLKHKAALNQLSIYAKKLREYKYLLILTSEIQNIQTSSNKVNLLSVSYGKLKEILANKDNQAANNPWILPNPPKDILNKIVLTCLQASPNDNNANLSANISLNKDSSSPDIPVTNTSNTSNTPVAETKQFIVCSTLLSKFVNFSSYIKSVIKTLLSSIKVLENGVKAYSTQLTQIQNTLQTYVNLKQKYVTELQNLKVKFIKERGIIRILKGKLKALDAQKKLLKFLPRLRYLPTPQSKISEIVQILLAKIVDPKLKYPIENIYDQKLNTSGSKKLAAARKKKWQRLEKYFGGIANMTKLTKAQISRNVAIIIGQKEEMNAVRECQKLGIKMFTIVDTNCNPTLADHIIPANDDSRSSVKYILTKFITRIRLAQKLRSRLAIYTVQN